MKTNTQTPSAAALAALEAEEERITAILGHTALAKACMDSWEFALKLRTGEVVRFESAILIDETWIRLENVLSLALPHKAPRGLDVRITDIVWVMDAPDGKPL